MTDPRAAGLPEHLRGIVARGLVRDQPIAQFELGSAKNFIYLIVDWKSARAAIVDPQSDLAPPLDALAAHGLQLECVLLTHTHFDHIAGLGGLAENFARLPVHVHPGDAPRISREWAERLELKSLADGQRLRIGATEIEVLHTPGHSAGECSYFLAGTQPPYLFTGDTIFIRDCGRTDFDGGSDDQMFASIQRVKQLPPETVFLVGHHYKPEVATTLARELRESPPFGVSSVAELAALP